MASSKALQVIFPFIGLLLLSFFSKPNMSSNLVILTHNSHNMNSSKSLIFLKNLQGCRLGDTKQGIHQIKKYLQRFGYITNNVIQKHSNPTFNDTFDHSLESALKTYQKNFNLVPSGILDSNTISQMAMPRCGVQDVINGKTTTKRNQNYENGPTHFHKVSHFSFFEGNLKWPSSKFHLTYAFHPSYPSEAIMAVSRAFSKWAMNTHFTFSQVVDYRKADIKISFERGDHGDDASFDGVGGILAHAYPPTDGRLHFDGDEPWSLGALSGYFDVETVALHEIGHVLGLQHSSIERAIMFPSIADGITKGLHGDDIAGIRALYRV